ncbi:zinc-finger homeodomain protein 6-like [Vicia villosa]|uniref:zinc-finger homeodomain protein 6-like n=1 Tax=Vicia villosa TaxID=3911 RepID=UPI00273ABDBD|nr:zinc-finger homeodomain protein 6-like [Vicia villosa]
METNMSPTTLGYNRDSSSSSPTPPQTNTLVFSNPPQNSHLNNNLHPDPDLIVTTSTSTIPITPQQTTTTAAATTTATTSATTIICYRECLRNHAASMGSHVVDGCGEFMPSGEEGTPQSFKCAACDCHRNFHRKHVQLPQHQQQQQQEQQQERQHQQQTQHVVNNGHILQFNTPSSSSQRFSHPTTSGHVPPLMMTFGSGPAESSSEDLNMLGAQFSTQTQQHQQQQQASKKRIRTKFSQLQKDKMMEFAQKIGWKIQKHDEQEVQQFCSQVGIRRQVFKVWMHNNKQAMKKTGNMQIVEM